MNGIKRLALSLIVFAAAATALAAAAGPKVTILGDSYSTFAGTMPQGYDNYYTGDNCGIASAADTWWAQVIAALDGKLEVNNSWSGSLISTKAHGSTKPFVSEDRLSNLGDPDVIFIFGGTNDAWDKVQLGSDVANPYDAAAWTAGNLAKLRPATAYLIHELKTRHPDARLFMIINSTDDVDGTSRVGIEASYANALAEIAAHESVPVVRLAGISKTSEHPNAAGMAAIAAQVLAVYNAPVDPDPADDDDEGEIVQIEGASPVEPLEVDGNLVYVLTNVSQGYTITVTKETKLLQALVVGGGGSGGWTIGGGGGGGQVLELDRSPEDALAVGTVLTVQVGAGGSPVIGDPCDGNGKPWKELGENGGNSTLTIGGTTYTALGGGAGAAFFRTNGASGASGGGGAGSGGTGGAATAGYAGGNVGKGSGENDHCAGGGGGATAAGENGMTVNQYSGRGGEGKAISLTGVSQVYGSGGGGGGGNGVSAAVGGTNAGAGGASGQTGGNGVDGFGGGGGGGSFDAQANRGYSGGRGGNGAVILVFEAPQVEEVADSLAITGSPSELGAVSPNYGVLSNLVAGSVTTLSAQPFILEGGTMTICEGYQLFTVENGRWALKAESAETTCEYAHVAGQQAKLVWRWRVATADDSRLGLAVR